MLIKSNKENTLLIKLSTAGQVFSVQNTSCIEHFSVSLFKYLIKIFVKVEFDICGVWAEGGGVGSVTLRTTNNQELKLKLYPERKCCKLLACNICRKCFFLKVVCIKYRYLLRMIVST